MNNRITDRDKKNLSDEAYYISDGSVMQLVAVSPVDSSEK